MADNDDQVQNAPKKGSFMKKMMVVAAVGLIIMLECVVTYFVLPSGNEVAAYQADQAASEEDNASDPDSESDDAPQPIRKTTELDLGYYTVTAHEPTSNVTLRIEFQLYGTTGLENSDEIKESFETNKHRFRDRVIFEIRSSELTDLTDPGLGLIKRRILEKSNDLFGDDVFEEMLISEFSFTEQ